MKRVAIVGLGLMGGSLGMALRAPARRSLARRPSPKSGRWFVTGVGRDKAGLKKAMSRGAADAVTTDLAGGVRDADVVVLAVSVDDIVPLAREARPHLKPGALVMDVGSVKGPIARALAGMDGFVGAHPMCGSEKSGIDNARADIFKGAPCVLTPTAKTSRGALKTAEGLWKSVGARVLRLSPDEHDRRVAMISHLPHLIAQTLVLMVSDEGRRASDRAGGQVGDLAAGSFRDATRVAGADPVLWAQIFSMNRPALLRAVAAFQKQLQTLAKAPTAAKLSHVNEGHRRLSGASA